MAERKAISRSMRGENLLGWILIRRSAANNTAPAIMLRNHTRTCVAVSRASTLWTILIRHLKSQEYLRLMKMQQQHCPLDRHKRIAPQERQPYRHDAKQACS